MQTTHSSVVSVVLVAKAAPNADMSQIWLPTRLQSLCVNSGHNLKSQYADNSRQRCQRGVGGQGRSQRCYVADFVAIKTTKLFCKQWAH